MNFIKTKFVAANILVIFEVLEVFTAIYPGAIAHFSLKKPLDFLKVVSINT